jgi:cytochrome P450
MTFLDECRATRAAVGGDADDAQVRVLREWLSSRPDALFDDLREHAPTLVLGRLALVTRLADVHDVLGRNDVFSVTPYGAAMMRINRGPNFLLGMDDGPEYRQDLSRLGRAFRRDDAERVRSIVAARTADALAPALAQGHLDLTDGFGRLVPALVVADYFGVPGPGPDALMTWARDIFTDGFANVLGIPLLSRRAMKASDAFRTHLDGVITAAKAAHASGSGRDDVLGRLISMQTEGDAGLSDVRIRDMLLWSVAGMIDNVNTAVCSATDHLLGHPDALHGATAAAMAHDDEQLQAYVLEALRFRTPTPVVTRLTTQAYTLSAGTRHETTIPAGTLTFAGLGAAMMDGSAIDAPSEFRLHRPAEHYLHFGTGLHRCLGVHIAMAQVTTMLARVLTLPGVRRGRGATGRLRVVGAFPKTFIVDFDPAAAP